MNDHIQRRDTSRALMEGDLVEVTAHLDIGVERGVDGIPRVSVYLSFSKILRIEVDPILRERIRANVRIYYTCGSSVVIPDVDRAADVENRA